MINELNVWEDGYIHSNDYFALVNVEFYFIDFVELDIISWVIELIGMFQFYKSFWDDCMCCSENNVCMVTDSCLVEWVVWRWQVESVCPSYGRECKTIKEGQHVTTCKIQTRW